MNTLDAVRAAGERVQGATAQLEGARRELYAAIRAAHDSGESNAAIARAAMLTREGIRYLLGRTQ